MHDGGYNMRLFRSKHLFGPYMDPAGNQAQNSGVNCYKFGVKIIGNYQFSNQPAYRAAGHNSFMITDDGKYYLFFHQRFSNRGEYHEVRVRQQFLNEDKWLVTAVYEYKSEKISIYEESEVIGDYELVNHGNAEKDGNMIRTQRIKLQKGGAVSGDMTGTWTMTKGDKYCYVLLSLNGVNYRGVFFRQTNDNGEKKMTFAAIGINNLNLWVAVFSLQLV
jgi:beta-xylosidase